MGMSISYRLFTDVFLNIVHQLVSFIYFEFVKISPAVKSTTKSSSNTTRSFLTLMQHSTQDGFSRTSSSRKSKIGSACTCPPTSLMDSSIRLSSAASPVYTTSSSNRMQIYSMEKFMSDKTSDFQENRDHVATENTTSNFDNYIIRQNTSTPQNIFGNLWDSSIKKIGEKKANMNKGSSKQHTIVRSRHFSERHSSLSTCSNNSEVSDNIDATHNISQDRKRRARQKKKNVRREYQTRKRRKKMERQRIKRKHKNFKFRLPFFGKKVEEDEVVVGEVHDNFLQPNLLCYVHMDPNRVPPESLWDYQVDAEKSLREAYQEDLAYMHSQSEEDPKAATILKKQMEKRNVFVDGFVRELRERNPAFQFNKHGAQMFWSMCKPTKKPFIGVSLNSGKYGGSGITLYDQGELFQ